MNANINTTDFSTPADANGISYDGSTIRYSNRHEVLNAEEQIRREAVAIADAAGMKNEVVSDTEQVTVKSGPTATDDGRILTVMRNGHRTISADQATEADVVEVMGMTMTLRDALRTGVVTRTAGGLQLGK